jgi:uncharacterized glyoxalase superfamily protein PhnB
MGKYQRPPYYGILKEAGREEDLRIAGEDRLSKKKRNYKGTIRKAEFTYKNFKFMTHDYKIANTYLVRHISLFHPSST